MVSVTDILLYPLSHVLMGEGGGEGDFGRRSALTREAAPLDGPKSPSP
jgi:hypothetical protein